MQLGRGHGLDDKVGSMKDSRKPVGVAALAVACVLGLSGCENLSDPSAAAVRIVDGQLIVVLCQTTQVRELSLKRRLDNQRTDVWLAEGDVRIAAGQELTESNLAELFERAETAPADLPASSQLTLLVQATPKSDNIAVAFDADLLSMDGWLRPDGSINDRPCRPGDG